MSKGSKRRPSQVSDEQVKDSWDTIFKASVGQVVQDKTLEETKTGTLSDAALVCMPSSRGNESKG